MSRSSWLDEAAYLRLIRGESSGLMAALGRAGLSLVATGYGGAVRARNLAFNRGWTTIHRAPVPVVSVGNVTLGGTGKTPMVEWVARWYRDRGVRVAILSRGYRHDDGPGVNDEAMVLERNLPDVPHLQDPDRARMATIAVEELDSQILVLDDGFQHRRLARDLDVVLLDALEPFGLGRIFPRGLLREPVSELRRAGLVVLSRADLVSADDRRRFREVAQRNAGPVHWIEARHAPLTLTDAYGNDSPLDQLAAARVAAFCGIGNPAGFQRTIEPLCGSLAASRQFPDHHAYTAADVDNLIRWAREVQAELVLTTQKDLVKLRIDRLGNAPLRALRIGLEVLDGADRLEQSLAALRPVSAG